MNNIPLILIIFSILIGLIVGLSILFYKLNKFKIEVHDAIYKLSNIYGKRYDGIQTEITAVVKYLSAEPDDTDVNGYATRLRTKIPAKNLVKVKVYIKRIQKTDKGWSLTIKGKTVNSMCELYEYYCVGYDEAIKSFDINEIESFTITLNP